MSSGAQLRVPLDGIPAERGTPSWEDLLVRDKSLLGTRVEKPPATSKVTTLGQQDAGAWRRISGRCCSKMPVDCAWFASQSTELSEPPTCSGWIICSRASLGQNCHRENNDLWHLPALLEVIRSVAGKPRREGAGTQEGGRFTKSRMLPAKGGGPGASLLSTGLRG